MRFSVWALFRVLFGALIVLTRNSARGPFGRAVPRFDSRSGLSRCAAPGTAAVRFGFADPYPCAALIYYIIFSVFSEPLRQNIAAIFAVVFLFSALNVNITPLLIKQ
jgi:hypothetical protein